MEKQPLNDQEVWRCITLWDILGLLWNSLWKVALQWQRFFLMLSPLRKKSHHKLLKKIESTNSHTPKKNIGVSHSFSVWLFLVVKSRTPPASEFPLKVPLSWYGGWSIIGYRVQFISPLSFEESFSFVLVYNNYLTWKGQWGCGCNYDDEHAYIDWVLPILYFLYKAIIIPLYFPFHFPMYFKFWNAWELWGQGQNGHNNWGYSLLPLYFCHNSMIIKHGY